VEKVGRRERERAEFREEVLLAARRIVLEEGFEALTMRKIADAIEYAPGTIYLYFESRDAIAFELCRAGFEAFLAALAPAAAIADPVDRLRELGRRYVRFGIENQETYRLIFMQEPKYASEAFQEDADAADSPGKRALGILVAIFEELRAAGRLKTSADPTALAEMIWSAVHGIVSLKITYDRHPETGTDELLRIQTDALVNGLVTF
jgi:AcrR family transcriptional regulator